MKPRDKFEADVKALAVENNNLKKIVYKNISSLTVEEKLLLKKPEEHAKEFSKTMDNLSSSYEEVKSDLTDTEQHRFQTLMLDTLNTIEIAELRAQQLFATLDLFDIRSVMLSQFLEISIQAKMQQYPLSNLEQPSLNSAENSSSARIIKSIPSASGRPEAKSSAYSPSSIALSTISSESASITATASNSSNEEVSESKIRMGR